MHRKRAGKRVFKPLIAGVFMILLLAEWGSHAAYPLHAEAVGASEITSVLHDNDLCDTLILCNDPTHRERELPNSFGEVTHFGGSIDIDARRVDSSFYRGAAPFGFPSAQPLTRPIGPPFHPPELI